MAFFTTKKDRKSYTTNTFEEEYIPMSHRHPKTPIHKKCYEQDCKHAAVKRKNKSEKKEEDAKKKWIKGGYGHANIRSWQQPNLPNPVTDEKPPLTQNSYNSGLGSDSGEDEGKPAFKTVKDEKGLDYSLTQIVRGEYNSPACFAKSFCSSSSVEVVKTVAPFKLKDDDAEVLDVDCGEDNDKEDKDDINLQDIEPELETESKRGG